MYNDANNRNNASNNAGNPNTNPNVNMYFPANNAQSIPVQQNNQQGYQYGTNQNQQSYNYPVPQVNHEEAHHDERANFVLPESAKLVMIICAILCFIIFLVLFLIK